MNFFSRFFGSKETNTLGLDVLIADLRAKVRAIDDRLHDQERTIKTLQLEWEESYDKITHLMARITKRAKAAASSTAQDAPGDENASPPSATPSAVGHHVLGTHSRMQEMRRRMNGVLPR